MKRTSSHIFFFAKDYRLMASGWQRAPYFRRYGRRLVSKTDNFVKEKLGGLP